MQAYTYTLYIYMYIYVQCRHLFRTCITTCKHIHIHCTYICIYVQCRYLFNCHLSSNPMKLSLYTMYSVVSVWISLLPTDIQCSHTSFKINSRFLLAVNTNLFYCTWVISCPSLNCSLLYNNIVNNYSNWNMHVFSGSVLPEEDLIEGRNVGDSAPISIPAWDLP